MKIYYFRSEPAANSVNKYLNPITKSAARIPNPAGSVLVDEIREADFATVSNFFAFYYFNKQIGQIRKWAEKTAEFNKKLVVWHSGDLNPPHIENVVYLQTSVDRSRQESFRIPIPYFIEDPIPAMFGGNLKPHKLTKSPEVGFCGYASSNLVTNVYGILKNLKNHLSSRLYPDYYSSGLIVPSVMLRRKILNIISDDLRIKDQFIIRDKFRAGVQINDRTKTVESERVVNDFFGNVSASQYVVCVRGYGNFSIRFYETLACGRIPLLIDTDTRLPFDDCIDYKQHCVWIPGGELKNLGDILIDFHSKLDEEKLYLIQAANRNLWQEYLSFDGFFNHFEQMMSRIL